MRSDPVERECFDAVGRLLMPSNRLALQLAADTGLRIGDVLAIKRETLAERFSVIEQKTGKRRSVRVGKKLLEELRALPIRGEFLFPGRDSTKHRTRQAVYADLKRAARFCRIPENLTPHSARKIFAAASFAKSGDLAKVQRMLNHSSPELTLFYVMAAAISSKRDRYRK